MQFNLFRKTDPASSLFQKQFFFSHSSLKKRSLERDKSLAIVKATTADIVNHGSTFAGSQMLNEEDPAIHIADYTPTRRDLPGSYNVTILHPYE